MKKCLKTGLIALLALTICLGFCTVASAACPHEYGDAVKIDNQYHQMTCKLCGATQKVKHSAVCTADTTCEVCGATGVTCEVHHKNTAMAHDTIYHWGCTACNNTADKAIHTVDANGVCTVCGATGLVQHAVKVTVPQTTVKLEIGNGAKPTASLGAAVSPDNTANKTLSYSSSDKTVATVSKDGVVTAGDVGTATITITPADTTASAITVTVTVTKKAVTGITMSQTNATLAPADTLQLTATVTPADAFNPAVEWTSGNTAVATVDDYGLVTAVANGTATITAKALDGSGKTATCKVTVDDQKVESISLNKYTKTLNLKKGQTVSFTLIPTVYPVDARNREVTFESSDKTLATVDQNGVVTANGNLKAGTVTIRVRAKDGSGVVASCVVTVKYNKITGIKLNQNTLKLEISSNSKGSNVLVPVIEPEKATDPSVKWESSDKTVATVDANGVVTAVAPGTCTVTCTAADNTGVKATCTVTVSNKLVTKVKLDRKTASLLMEEGSPVTLQLNATVTPADAANRTLKWTSNDPTVATVNKNGLVTAHKPGTCKIYARATDGSGKRYYCTVTVTNSLIDSITLNATSKALTLKKGRTVTYTLTAKIKPATAANEKIFWSSSNKDVATVDENGRITAVGAGRCTITAANEDGSVKATCKVTVRKRDVAKIKLNTTGVTLKLIKGKTVTYQLKAGVSPTNAYNRDVKWSSSNPNVASVNENTGKVTAKKRGTATITAKALDGSNKSASCMVKVVNTKITSIKASPASKSLTLKEGEKITQKISLTYKPANATEPSFKWSSSKPDVATVDKNGLVTAVKAGTTTITAKAKDGSGKKATIKITVICKKVTSIKLSETSRTFVLSEGGPTSFTLNATVSPSDASYRKITWESSDTNVAKVSQDGEVTVLKFGTCKIIARATDGSGVYAVCNLTVK